MKYFRIDYLNAYGEKGNCTESAKNEKEAIAKFEQWMPEGEIIEIEEI